MKQTKTIKEVIRELQAYPENYLVYAYEGEFTGLVIMTPGMADQVGSIDAPCFFPSEGNNAG